jgi:hypothetical protein
MVYNIKYDECLKTIILIPKIAAHCCPNVVRAYADFGSTIIDDNDEDGEFQLTSTTIIRQVCHFRQKFGKIRFLTFESDSEN